MRLAALTIRDCIKLPVVFDPNIKPAERMILQKSLMVVRK